MIQLLADRPDMNSDVSIEHYHFIPENATQQVISVEYATRK